MTPWETLFTIRRLAHAAIRTGHNPEAVLREIRTLAQVMEPDEPSNRIVNPLHADQEKWTVPADAGAHAAPA